MKKILLFLVTVIFSVNLFAQADSTNLDLSEYGVKIEPDKRLMVVLSSLQVADLDTPLSETGEKFRKELRADLQKANPELQRKIDIFISQYKKRHPNASNEQLIAPFISMAYSLSNVPNLKEPERSDDLPGNLLEVLDYAVLVREFYNTPGIAEKIDGYYINNQKAGDELRPSAREMVRELTAYLKTRPQLSYIERIKAEDTDDKKKKDTKKTALIEKYRVFKIIPEMLVSKGTINFLNVGDDYFAIVPPEIDLSLSDARRGYLQYVLDPFVLKYAREILTQSVGIKKLLEDRREAGVNVSPDPFLAVSRSLVAAVDVREEEYRKTQIATQQARRKIDSLKSDDAKQDVVAELNRFTESLADESALKLSESFEKGAVLAFYFAEKLKGTEDSGFDISSSLKDWIVSLNPAEENKRLDQFAEARNRAAAARKTNNFVSSLVGNTLTAKLFEIDKLIEEKKYELAESELTTLLNENPSEIRIHYALGQVVNLSAAELKDDRKMQERLKLAIFHYSNVIRAATPITEKISEADRAWVSLSYFALGRIYEYYDQNEYALKIYEAALKIGNVKGGAYQKALEAKERLEKNR